MNKRKKKEWRQLFPVAEHSSVFLSFLYVKKKKKSYGCRTWNFFQWHVKSEKKREKIIDGSGIRTRDILVTGSDVDH